MSDNNLDMIRNLEHRIRDLESTVERLTDAINGILLLLMERIEYPSNRDGAEDLETLSDIYSEAP